MSALYQRNIRKDPKDYVVHMTSREYSQVVQLSEDISSGSSHQRISTWSRTVYSIPCSCGEIYKSKIGRPLKVRQEEHWKAVVRGEIEKLGMADVICTEKENHLPFCNEVELIDRAEHWRIRRLKESAHMLGYNDLLSRPSIELNTIWEPIIKRLDKKIWTWIQVKKKSYIIVVILVK